MGTLLPKTGIKVFSFFRICYFFCLSPDCVGMDAESNLSQRLMSLWLKRNLIEIEPA